MYVVSSCRISETHPVSVILELKFEPEGFQLFLVNFFFFFFSDVDLLVDGYAYILDL